MKTQIDLKSVIIGAGVGATALLAMGAGEGESRQIGRFQCSSGGDMAIIVDTVTGRAWAQRANNFSVTGAPAGFFEKKPDR